MRGENKEKLTSGKEGEMNNRKREGSVALKMEKWSPFASPSQYLYEERGLVAQKPNSGTGRLDLKERERVNKKMCVLRFEMPLTSCAWAGCDCGERQQLKDLTRTGSLTNQPKRDKWHHQPHDK